MLYGVCIALFILFVICAGKILFARGLLYLDQGRIEEAMKSFQAITPSSLLVEFCVANPKLLATDSGV